VFPETMVVNVSGSTSIGGQNDRPGSSQGCWLSIGEDNYELSMPRLSIVPIVVDG
jgi:hypothetical protein